MAKKQWDAEYEVDELLAGALIAEAFPEIEPTAVRLLGAGFDNTAFLVNESYVFRFPRRQVAIPLIETECVFLPEACRSLPLAVPVPQWVATLAGRFPWPFAGYRKLKGQTACRASLSDADRERAASCLGAFLAVLHAIPLEEGRRLGLGPDRIGKLDCERLVGQGLKFADDLCAYGILPQADSVRRLLRDRRKIAAGPARTAVVHGDFYARHLLVDDNRSICGVIDWGDVHLGHPAVDLSIARGFLPPTARDSFLRAYGEISSETWELAGLRSLYLSLVLTAYGHDRGDRALVAEGLRSLAYALIDA